MRPVCSGNKPENCYHIKRLGEARFTPDRRAVRFIAYKFDVTLIFHMHSTTKD
jgi:hypothetical protein